MARKTLLNEHEIRKFLKLANITTVGDTKIQEMGHGGGAYARDEEDPAGEVEDVEVDAAAELEDDGEPVALDAAEQDVEDVDVELDAAASIDPSEAEELLAKIVDVVADQLGIADRVDVEAGEEEAMDDMGLDAEPVDMEPEAALAPEEGGEESLGAPDDLAADADEEEPEPMMEEATDEKDDLVAEVARRVAERLKQQNQQEAMVDTLAERILNRLINK